MDWGRGGIIIVSGWRGRKDNDVIGCACHPQPQKELFAGCHCHFNQAGSRVGWVVVERSAVHRPAMGCGGEAPPLQTSGFESHATTTTTTLAWTRQTPKQNIPSVLPSLLLLWLVPSYSFNPHISHSLSFGAEFQISQITLRWPSLRSPATLRSLQPMQIASDLRWVF
jgi:hypothetical protein